MVLAAVVLVAETERPRPDGPSTASAAFRPPPGPGVHGRPDAPVQPAARPGGEPARDRSARRSRQQGWSGSSKDPPPARRQHRFVLPDGALHAGGEEQCADRHPALQAGIHLAGRLDPVGQLTGADKRGRENDLTGEQTV